MPQPIFNAFTFGFLEALTKDCFGTGVPISLTAHATQLVAMRCDQFQRTSAWRDTLAWATENGHSENSTLRAGGRAFWATMREPDLTVGFQDGGWSAYEFPTRLRLEAIHRLPLVAFKTPDGRVDVIEYKAAA